MKNNISIFNIMICLLFLTFIFTLDAFSQQLTPEQIYKKVTNTVVVIHAYDYKNSIKKQGSGVVINDKGYVVTNYHVLAGCDRLEILHNKEIIPYVDIIGIDVEKDILILKIKAKKFPAIKIGDSKKLNVGQRVYAIGSPLGYENTISEGIISGLRSYEESEKNFIQITTSISAGSSGGAIVNDIGELIGISTLSAKEGQNLNFAIPIDAVLSVEISSYSKNDSYKNYELFYKGNAEYEKGNHQTAILFYTKFITEYPNKAEAYYNRGKVKGELKDYRGAIQDYSKVIDINPYSINAYFNRGHDKIKLDDYRGAIRDFDEAIKIDPSFSNAYAIRGCAKKELEDYLGAIPDFNKAIEINPTDAATYYNLGNTKIKLNYFRSAIQDFNKAIEINPNFVEVYYNRGLTKNVLEDNRGAIQDFNKAIELNPKHADAYFGRGLSKFLLKDKIGAYVDWSKAGELGLDKAYDVIRKYCN